VALGVGFGAFVEELSHAGPRISPDRDVRPLGPIVLFPVPMNPLRTIGRIA